MCTFVIIGITHSKRHTTNIKPTMQNSKPKAPRPPTETNANVILCTYSTSAPADHTLPYAYMLIYFLNYQ